MKKYFLTTALMGTFIAPAFGADKIITSANTCTVDVLGVHENDAIANTIATWTLNEYECGAGQYLLNSDGTLECTECPVGSYCPGGKFTVESENNGATTCPTDYTSDAGSTAESECYIGCELACSANVECPPHSNNCTHSEFKTTGKQFSGETCNAYPSVCPIADFQCDMGYTKTDISAVEIFEKYATLLNSGKLNSAVFLYCGLDGNDLTPNEESTLSNTFNFLRNNVDDCSYVSPGQIMMLPEDMSFAFILTVTQNEYSRESTPGAVNMDGHRYLLRNADFKPVISGENMWYRYSEILLPTTDTVTLNQFKNGDIVPPEDIVTETEMLEWASTMFSKDFMNKVQNMNGDLDLMRLLFFTYRNISLPNTWITSLTDDSFGLVMDLINSSLFVAITQVFSDEEALSLLFGGGAYCANNTINIDWNPDNGGEHIKNMCTYEGSVTLPTPDPVKPGYTFTGWKLVE